MSTPEKDIHNIQKEAEEALRNGEIEKAAELYLQIFQEGPESAYGYFRLAEAFYNKNDRENARKYLLKAVEFAPDMLSVRLLLGKTYLESDMPKKALEQFRKVIELDPDDHESYFYLALSCINLDLADEAEAFALEALNREPDDESYLILLGQIYIKKSDFSAAYKYLSHESVLEKGDAESLNLLAECAGQIGDLSARLAALERSLDRDPGQEEITKAYADLKEQLQRKSGSTTSKKKTAIFATVDSFIHDIFKDYGKIGGCQRPVHEVHFVSTERLTRL